MKNVTALCWLLCLVVCGCKVTALTASVQEEAILMKIVCRNDNTLKQDILYRLHFGKGKDIVVENADGSLNIAATFSLSEVTIYHVQDLETDLKAVMGIISVDLDWSRTTVDPNRPLANAPGGEGAAQLIH